MGINLCSECLKKQQKIDALLEENLRLKQKLKYQERKEKEGLFGSSTSSAKLPVKAHSAKAGRGKRKGAKQGHQGVGRQRCPEGEAEQVVTVGDSIGSQCPNCGRLLEEKGTEERLVIESHPLKAHRVLYRLAKKYCPHCQKVFQTHAPGVLPKSLYGNQLITTATVMHYLHGIPMGRVCEQTQIGPGSLVEIFHRLARLFEKIPPLLIEQYRQAPVKHADETSWRTEGQNGYAWLFATEKLSIFQFRKSRSASVVQAVFGENPLPGILVVDRYAGYNKAPCTLQYCYAHLLREVEDLQKEFPDSEEVQEFVSTFIPLLTLAMGLRHQRLSPAQFQRKATQVQSQIQTTVKSPAQHPGIRRIQDIFRENESRLYHWAKDRNVPAENNLAERDLRPTVIARKVSFGSQSDAGAYTRGVLMTVLGSLKKRGIDATTHLKRVLDELAKNIHQDPFPLLFPRDPPNPKPSLSI